MKRWSMLAIGVGTYALALIVTAPAMLADAGLQRASNGRLRLAETRGTLWSGVGQLDVLDINGKISYENPLEWRLQSGTLFRAPLVYEIRFGHGSRPFSLMMYWSRMEFSNVDVNLPAAAFSQALPRLGPLELSGNVNVKTRSLVLRSGTMQGSTTLEWREAGSALAPVSPLGNYELRFEGAGSETRATLNTLQGPLQISGRGAWANGHAPVFLATAHVPPELRQQLAPFLRLITVERSDGSFELQLK